MKRDYDEVLSEYGISAYDETSQGAAMTQREELSDDQKKLNLLLGLEKETLADMAHQQSKIIENLQNAAKEQAAPQWISVSERLPDEGVLCIVFGVNGVVNNHFEYYKPTHIQGYFDSVIDGCVFELTEVTHWMPLPAAPEQNK